MKDGAVAAAEAHGFEGAPVEAAGSRETAHQRDVKPRAPLDRHPRLERIERAPAHPHDDSPRFSLSASGYRDWNSTAANLCNQRPRGQKYRAKSGAGKRTYL